MTSTTPAEQPRGIRTRFRWLGPHLRVQSVRNLTLRKLKELEIDALLLDVDSTLKEYNESLASPEVVAWFKGLRDAGIGLCLVSNGRARRIQVFAEDLDIPYIATAMKPLPFGVRRAVRQMGFDLSRTAMVGDQLFADVFAGRLAGMKTVLVRPISPEQEPWFTRLKRLPERILLNWLAIIEEQIE